MKQMFFCKKSRFLQKKKKKKNHEIFKNSILCNKHTFQISKHFGNKMDYKRERMPKVKPIPHPLPLPSLRVSVLLLRTGDNSIKTYPIDNGMIPLHICNRDLNLKLPWNHLHDFNF